MISTHNVSKTYGTTIALDDVSLTAEVGRTTVLIGPSGCGKSTMLRLLNGLTRPDRGRVSFDGTSLSTDNLMAIRRRMGYVIQEGGLFPHLTVRQNIILAARQLRWPPGRIDGRVTELMELTHLPAHAMDRYPAEVSGGQRQRVSLMRALMLDPDVLLLDEPLGALDPMIRANLQEELRDVFRSLGKTVVLVTHDMGEAAYFGDTIVLLRQGRIVQCGSAWELLRNPAEPFVTEFIQAQRNPLDSLVEGAP